MKPHSRQLFAVLAVMLLASCGKDPELVRKSGEQQTEIARLRGELMLLDEKLKNLPEDRSAELAEARMTADAQAAELAKLEAEVGKLQARKLELKKEFEEYKRKYVVR